MKVSYNWLQTYFADPLPQPEEVAEALTFHAFEIDDVIEKGGDTMIDVDVLANRGSDCLCHRGIAKELSVILDRPLQQDPLREAPELKTSSAIAINVKATELVTRFSLAQVNGVSIGPSPDWLRERLETIGQKSINNVVDATNYVMFSIGQPLHAFDADKVSGGTKTIGVRKASMGEKITSLTGEEYELDDSNLLIVDGEDDRPLGIAGIKGGQAAEVDTKTTNIILEAANFNYVSVRKTSQKLKLQTDASVRFQNQPAAELPPYALRDAVELILEIAGGTYEGGADWNPNPQTAETVSITKEHTNALLGTNLTVADIEAIITRFGWVAQIEGNNITITVPWERKDIQIAEDVIEEIGRINGYLKLESKQLFDLAEPPKINKRFYYTEKIRKKLTSVGFTEVLTHPITDHGVVALANALASDKNHMRENLREGLQSVLTRNSYQAPLLGLEQIKVFEIGFVWKGLSEDGRAKEVLTLGLGVAFPKKIKGCLPDDIVLGAVSALEEALGVTIGTKPQSGILEVNIDKLLEKLPDPETYDLVEIDHGDRRYQPFSHYPFVLRDIAVWVPESMSANDVLAIIQEKGGELVVRHDLFDEFTKDGRTSYAFHLVFQSSDKTLSDDEVNQLMGAIESSLRELGGDVR